jgi:RNA polymerase sigma factor (sigma-70 family)
MDEIAPTDWDCAQARADDLATLLCEWQATGSHAALEDLIRSAEPIVSVVIARVLGQRGIRDPAALDEALALVFNHLRRLPGPAAGEPAVATFDPGRGTAADHGSAFLKRLAHDRAIDIARRCRRQARRESTFSALDDAAVSRLQEPATVSTAGVADDEPDEQDEQLLARAVAGLDLREQQLVRLLLEGKSQAVIAHVLGVCEGTISRLRCRVIAKLQTAIRRPPSAAHEETPAPRARAARHGPAPASPRRGPPEPFAPA